MARLGTAAPPAIEHRASPQRRWGGVFGALTIYAAQAEAFDREEVAFLVQLAADISYGVANLRRQKQ